MTMDGPRTSRLAFAGVSALTVLTWYALPDAVRSRRARAVIKAGLLGVTAAGAVMIPQVFPEVRDFRPGPLIDLPAPALVSLGVGATALAAAGTVWFEKAVFASGERRRARGVRCAHTPPAVAMALATGAVALADWTKLAGMDRWHPSV
ncbi:hypothetical protein PROP_03099 [Propionicimonas sp. T2.31MG-18]|uniref:hypothetical protein n=1 Tax=Propionicimonas sp. T2.31MG-18 TaxID=3157620 RepID=UPI0035E60354